MDSEILKQYIAIDLKSFYASVECVERGLDPLDTCLVVADPTRTEKTICLAVSPALKQYGLGGRPRLFEVVQKVREVNRQRGHQGKSYSKCKLDSNNDLALAISLVTTGSHQEGLRACTSFIQDHQYAQLDERMAVFAENHPVR